MSTSNALPTTIRRTLCILVLVVAVMPLAHVIHSQESQAFRVMVLEERADYWNERLSAQEQDFEIMPVPQPDFFNMLMEMFAAGETIHVIEAPSDAIKMIAQEMPESLLDLTSMGRQLNSLGLEPFTVDGRIVGWHSQRDLIIAFGGPYEIVGMEAVNWLLGLSRPAGVICVDFTGYAPGSQVNVAIIQGVIIAVTPGGGEVVDYPGSRVLQVNNPSSVITLPRSASFVELDAANYGGRDITVTFYDVSGGTALQMLTATNAFTSLQQQGNGLLVITTDNYSAELLIRQVCYLPE
jgi:hypothetical protein